jgi:subfamily B ATP-binding cassette protein HlyB/CyaB
MAAICRGRTVFIIAHRLSAVRLANRVFVLEKGRIVEGGPPRALLEKKGKFYQMVKSQEGALAPALAPARPASATIKPPTKQ